MPKIKPNIHINGVRYMFYDFVEPRNLQVYKDSVKKETPKRKIRSIRVKSGVKEGQYAMYLEYNM